MITQLGIVAGDIWHYLEKHEQASLTEIVQNIDNSRNLIVMGLGWLTREGYIILEEQDSDYRYSLRN